MRRIRRCFVTSTASRPTARVMRSVLPSVLSLALLLCTPGVASADPGPGAGPDSMAALIADVAKANQRLEDLTGQIQTEQQAVDKDLGDVENVREKGRS